MADRDRPLALKFLSGLHPGEVLPLSGVKELIIGRSGDVGLALPEEMVSRRHARILRKSGGLEIEDLGSTNGTFVNGERIKAATPLSVSDRILIGSSIMRLVDEADVDSAPTHSNPRPEVEDKGARRTKTTTAQGVGGFGARERTDKHPAAASGATRSMAGLLDEIPLPDLLQLFGSSKKTGVLVLTAPGGTVGKIFLKKGLIRFASLDDVETMPPIKVLIRLLDWQKGTFELQPPDEREAIPGEVEIAVQDIMIEGFRQIDEMQRLAPRLPKPTARLRIPKPLLPSLTELTVTELHVLQLAWNHDKFQEVVDNAFQTDLEVVQALLALVDRGFIQVG
jgi:hypothetical protein